MIKIPRIQIAGIKNTDEVDLCAAAGADGFGLLQMLDYPRGDALDAETVAHLSSYIRTNVPNGLSVIISHSIDLHSITHAAEQSGSDAFQVHNDSSHEMDMKSLHDIKTALKQTALIKVLHIPNGGPIDAALVVQASAIAEIADAIIFDTKTIEHIDGKDYETLGGTGKLNSWDIARDLVQIIAPTPVIYAGGLTPENVGDAIRHIRPYAVDVNSGVRIDGSVDKDPEKVRAFVQNARAAFEEIG